MEKVVANRTLINVIVGSVLVLSITSCDEIGNKINELQQPDAEEVLSSYLDAFLKGRAVEAYRYLSDEDKSIKSLSEYKSEISTDNNLFVSYVESRTSFKVLNISQSGSTARADVELTLPDISAVFTDIMAFVLGSVFGGEDEAEGEAKIKELIADKYKAGEIPTTTENKKFNLLKEKDGWKVFLNWKSEKEAEEAARTAKAAEETAKAAEEAAKATEEEVAREKEEKISALLSEAKQLRKSKKLSGAIQKYEEVLTLNSEMVEAKKAIEETKQEMEDIKEKQAYLSKVNLYNLNAKYYKTNLEENVPGVYFKLKNNGDRTLKKVEVTIYFKDAEGIVISEDKYNPVWVTEHSSGKANKLLKPNYVWQQEKGKFYRADSVPDEWKEGSVSANITDIEFAEL